MRQLAHALRATLLAWGALLAYGLARALDDASKERMENDGQVH